MTETRNQYESQIVADEELDEPKRYKVLLHNDDYTTMEFVVLVLKKIFNKTEAEATQIMMKVHNEGVGVCGIYTAEVAETKVHLVRNMAKKQGYPLMCTMEEV
ncbi:MAG: ATP-dependent Clp protease adapter ClpS [Desulfonatronovibrionaceae bacterium]